MTDEQIKELGNEYADENLIFDCFRENIANAHADGIRKGMELVLNTLDYAKNTISESLPKVIVR